MENPNIISAILGVAGVVLGYPALKYLWPVIRDSLQAQGGQWRAENKFLSQLQQDLKLVKEERDATRLQANQLFVQVAKLEAQVEILSARLEASNAKIEELTAAFRSQSKPR